MDKDEITKDMFLAYREVQEAGFYNMVMEAENARQDAGLTKDQYWTIIRNYGYLRNKFGTIED